MPLLLATASDPLGQVGTAQTLLERGPISFVAIIALAALGVTMRALLREKDKRLEDMRLLADISKRQELMASELKELARDLVEAAQEPRRRRRKTVDDMPAVKESP